MKPFCEKPVVLLNPKLSEFVYSHVNVQIYIHDKHVGFFNDLRYNDFTQYYPKRHGVTPDNYEHSYVIDSFGETIPLYMCVPCGKCRICKNRKARELAARCVAETNEYDSTPYFVTFTYDNEHLPSDGVRKCDVQLFLKRLRSRLDYYGIEHSIRYLVVAEYGSKTLRPHYHAIIWNFPQSECFPTLISVIKFIERCWSLFKLDKNNKRIPMKNIDGSVLCYPNSGKIIYETEKIGFIKVLPVKDGCPAYILKYMRKPCLVPLGKNNTFLLASNRNGGIGSAFIRRNRELFLKNPDLESLTLVDKVVSGQVVKMPITPYVKNILLGTPSTYIKCKQYEILRDFTHSYKLLNIMYERLRQLDSFRTDSFGRKVVFNSLCDLGESELIKKACFRIPFMNLSMPLRNENIYTFVKESEIISMIYEYKDKLEFLGEKILEMEDFSPYFAHVEKVKQMRQLMLSARYKDAPERDVNAFVDNLDYQLKRSQHKEVF